MMLHTVHCLSYVTGMGVVLQFKPIQFYQFIYIFILINHRTSNMTYTITVVPTFCYTPYMFQHTTTIKDNTIFASQASGFT